ncbi:MAG: hypothetical protein RIT45_579 [Pseudomonadota bacterium]|jgi:hypothetical protein
MKIASPFLALLVLVSFVAACSTEGGTTDTGGNTTPDTADTAAEDTAGGGDADAAATDTADASGDVQDVSATDSSVVDTSETTDTSPVACTSDKYCETLLKATLKPCEAAVCKEGVCEAVYKTGTCCNDAQCDDGVTCTVDKCDLATNTCSNKTKANCCEGQQTFLDVGFEQSSFEDFKAVEGPSNGNVKWQLSTNRAHTGKTSMYLGNGCNVYDNSYTPEGGCAQGAAPKSVLSNLSSKEVILPQGKQAVAHFWVWIQAEPMYTKDLTPGTCTPACAKGTSCVKLDDTPGVCLPENDVLRVYVDTTGPAADPVWISTEVGKSTEGWHHVSVNLAAFQKAGSDTAVKLRWEFATNNVNNDKEGVYIDDVVIETLCAGNDTLCEGSASCKDDGNPCTSEACTVFANDKSTGICFYDQTPNCCVGAGDCNDKNDCTVDTCKKEESAAQGSCDHVPDASNVACCQESTIYSDGFESGSISSWQHVGTNSKTVKWQHNSKEGKSGSASLYFGNGQFSGYDDPTLGKGKGPRGSVCTKPLKISAGTVYNVLTFQLKLKTEWSGQPAENYVNPPVKAGEGAPKLDELRVEVALPTGLVPAWTSDSVKGTTGGEWLPIVVPLDQFAGKEAGICFTFDAGDDLGNTDGGVWIDDVAFGVKCTKQECSIDSQCGDKCGACTTPSCSQGACVCTPIPSCCKGPTDCDDGDSCTNDSCVEGSCKHELSDPKCCSDKSGDKALLSADFENNGQLPAGWKPTKLSGQPPFGSGASYDQTIVWFASPNKSKPGAGSYSMCFSDVNGTMNAGDKVPAGKVATHIIEVPANGNTVVTFDLFLSTEWDDVAAFKLYPFAVDQLVLNAVDTEEADPTKARTLLWDSYDIEGTTKGKWKAIVASIPASLAGKKIRLEFYFDAGNKNANNYDGACVDNLVVETFCAAPACLSDADCKPGTPDACKSYACSKTGAVFACTTEFKEGPGCCQQTVALAGENGEGGSLVKWAGTSSSDAVKWQVIDHKYLLDKKEIYFGNPVNWNYADGSGKACASDSDCSSGETCKGSLNKKICGKPVKGSLTSDAFQLSTDSGKSAQLRFRIYLDVEPSFETFQIWYVDETGAEKSLLWDKNNDKDFKATDFKSVVEKVVNIEPLKIGADVRLRFKFDSGDSSKNEQFEGIFLDEVIIEEPCKL